MGHHHIVRRGDSLWGLACKYLGKGAHWPDIYKYHNAEVKRRRGRGHERMKIDDPNLIFVGQSIYIPSRPKHPSLSGPATGGKPQAGKPAVGIDLKIDYTIGHDTLPIKYAAIFIDYTIKTEITGKIGIELASSDKYRHNLELLMSKDTLQAKQKLKEAYDPAVAALTVAPEVLFKSGRVKIKAPIATNANIGPYSIEIQAETPMKMSGTLKPPSVNGFLEIGPQKYKYSADIELKAEMEWHPRPSVRVEELAKAPVPNSKEVFAESYHQNTLDYTGDGDNGILATVVYTIMGLAAMWCMRGAMLKNQVTSIMPFTHAVNLPKKDA